MNAVTYDPVRIGIVSISDRASAGVYQDKGLPALQDWLGRALRNPVTFDSRLIPDEKDAISAALIASFSSGIKRESKVTGLRRARPSQSCRAGRPLSSYTPVEARSLTDTMPMRTGSKGTAFM